MKVPKELEFTAEDFKIGEWEKYGEAECKEIACDANRILAEKLAKCPVVYGWTDSNTWSGRHTDNTHKAYLVGIEKL